VLLLPTALMLVLPLLGLLLLLSLLPLLGLLLAPVSLLESARDTVVAAMLVNGTTCKVPAPRKEGTTAVQTGLATAFPGAAAPCCCDCSWVRRPS